MAEWRTPQWIREQIGLLSEQEKARFDVLREKAQAGGAGDPDCWALTEVLEDKPEVATLILLRRLWQESIEPQGQAPLDLERAQRLGLADQMVLLPDSGDSLRRLLAGGADPEELGSFARVVAYEAVYRAMAILDEGGDGSLGEGFPRWALVEHGPDNLPTGRRMEGLHELM